MPDTKPLGRYTERKETVRRIVKVGMARKALRNADLGGAINVNTFGHKKGAPETFNLGELWRIDDILHFTDDEILQMFGRQPRKGR